MLHAGDYIIFDRSAQGYGRRSIHPPKSGIIIKQLKSGRYIVRADDGSARLIDPYDSATWGDMVRI